jgi:hypothetical protein
MKPLSDHLRELMAELPQAILLSIMTAVATLALVIVVSAVLGTENAEHRRATACFARDTTILLRQIVLASDDLRDKIDLTNFPVMDLHGIDCQSIYEDYLERDQ